MEMYFWKTKNVQTLNVLLVKNVDKDFSNTKILLIEEHCSLNYGR